jgi:tetratricopeptide (TPR) repeat protein
VKEDDSPAPKVMFKPGTALETTTDTQDIVATWDVELAKKQVATFPDSPEASFILAVALTRTSRVEEALQEVQRARRLAGGKGGPAYFDQMIDQYEKMLTSYPNDNQVRYGLAWAYYMKAYLLGQHSRRVAKWKAVNMPQAANAATPAPATTSGAGTNGKDIAKALQSGNLAALAGAAAQVASGKGEMPHVPSALEGVEPADAPVIKGLYEKALGQLDEFLKRDPKDVWARSYGAHLRAEYTGNINASIAEWSSLAKEFPNNPAPYFFLGEGYLKQGNLKESLNNVGKAISLRALGN